MSDKYILYISYNECSQLVLHPNKFELYLCEYTISVAKCRQNIGSEERFSRFYL